MAESQRTSHRSGRDGRRLRAGVRWAHAARLPGVLTVLLGCLWIVTAGAAQAGQAGTAAGSGWKVERTPNQNRDAAGTNELSAVSCSSGRACTAVGSHAASLSSTGLPLAERWNGTRWRVQAVPAPAGSTTSLLSGVSCTSPNACTAVGSYGTAAGRVLAVAERWNGARWRIQAVPRAASTELFGVSCSAARACTAVGRQNTRTGGTRLLAEAWNGTRWRVQAVPLPRGSPGGILAAVSCTSPRACTATGANFSATRPTLAERWNGTRWRVQRTPAPANVGASQQEPELNAVSCASATSCTASGAYAPGGHSAYFLEAWNGRSWRLVTAPHPAGFLAGALNGASCVPARCTAVGAWSGGPIFTATLAMAN